MQWAASKIELIFVSDKPSFQKSGIGPNTISHIMKTLQSLILDQFTCRPWVGVDWGLHPPPSSSASTLQTSATSSAVSWTLQQCYVSEARSTGLWWVTVIHSTTRTVFSCLWTLRELQLYWHCFHVQTPEAQVLCVHPDAENGTGTHSCQEPSNVTTTHYDIWTV